MDALGLQTFSQKVFLIGLLLLSTIQDTVPSIVDKLHGTGVVRGIPPPWTPSFDPFGHQHAEDCQSQYTPVVGIVMRVLRL